MPRAFAIRDQGWTLAVAAALIATIALAVLLREDRADAASGGCRPNCVVLIEVNGLMPSDVTAQTTPFLWALAHAGQTEYSAALRNRGGWIWQAARADASASNAAATASLLTGGYPEEDGVPADTYYDPTRSSSPWFSLGAAGTGSSQTAPTGESDLSATTIVKATTDSNESAATFIGDPALRMIVNGATVDVASRSYGDATFAWYPTAPNDGDPHLCPPTTPLDTANAPSPSPPVCPANDVQTLQQATTYLTGTGAGTPLTYVYLAELGIVKQLNGQISAGPPSASPTTATGASGPSGPTGTPSVGEALKSTDQAIASLVEQYSQQHQQEWASTVVMVVGNHGYELTPLAHRVPDPTNDPLSGTPPSANTDLAAYVDADSNHKAILVAQGSMATIYDTGDKDPTAKAATLAKLRTDVLNVNASPSCQADKVNKQCIQDVLYVDPTSPTPGAGDTTVGDSHPDWTVAHVHPSWRQDSVDLKRCDAQAPYVSPLLVADLTKTYRGCPTTGTGGDLFVVMTPGWAAGRADPSVNSSDPTSGTGPTHLNYTDPVNPYNVSAGGPRNRAIAAIVNGPDTGTGQVLAFPWSPGTDDGRSPVTKGPDTGDPRNENNSGTALYYGPTGYDAANTYQPSTAQTGEPANSIPGDDAIVSGAVVQSCASPASPQACAAVGREKQAQTVDFAPTIAALMQVSMPSIQLAGRILQESFARTLSLPNLDAPLPPPDPDPCVVNPASCVLPPPVQIVTAPPVDPFDFTGLVRNVHAQIGTMVNKVFYPVAQAKPGADLSTLQLGADFGKPKSEVTITLYHVAATETRRRVRVTRSRRAHGARRRVTTPRSGPMRLVTLVRFCPFTVTRGPDVKLRFEVPPAFSPDHIGITTQEVADGPATTGAAESGACAAGGPLHFHPVGPTAGSIVPVEDASFLHQRKAAAPTRSPSAHRHRGRR